MTKSNPPIIYPIGTVLYDTLYDETLIVLTDATPVECTHVNGSISVNWYFNAVAIDDHSDRPQPGHIYDYLLIDDVAPNRYTVITE